MQKNLDKITKHINNLTRYLLERLKEIKDIIIYPNNNTKAGVIAFNIKNKPSNEVGNYLSDKNICVRTGLHCAPLVHKFYNTLDCGMIRVSFSYFNKKRDVDKLVDALKQLD